MAPIRQVTQLILLGIVLLGLPAAARAAGPTVEIDNMAYAPPDVTVSVGESITWVNNDTAPHNAVARDNSWRTPILQTGQDAAVTFDAVGKVQYYCSLHPGMIANFTVVQAALPATDTVDGSAVRAAGSGDRGERFAPWLAVLGCLLVLAAVARQRMSSR